MTEVLRDNTALHRLEMDAPGGLALANYRLVPGVMIVTHTEVPEASQGKGIGSRLVRGVLEFARGKGLKVEARCSFVAAYLKSHPEFNDLVA